MVGQVTGCDPAVMTTADFGRLFTAYRMQFETIAYRYVRNAAVAEDLVSDSFMAFWENRMRLSEGVNIQAYILIIVRNKCLDWLRAQSLHLKIEQEVYQLQRRKLDADIRSLQAFNPEEIFSEEVARIVRQSLEKMPELMREVFVDHRFGEMSYKQIAEKHSITPRRVEFELAKALRELRVALKDYLPALLFLLSGMPCS